MPDGGPTASNEDGKRIPLIRWLIPCLLIGMPAIGYLLATWSEGPETQFEWMSLQQMYKSTQPGPLQKLKYKLVSIAEPLLKWYKPNRPNILINVDLFGVPARREAPSGIGSPCSTNQEGAKAWILQETDIRKVRDKIKDANGFDYITSAPGTTSDGGRAQVQTTLQMESIVSATGSASTFPVGVTVDLNPKIVAHSIQLVVGVTLTSTTATGGTNTIRTDAAVCSRALLPNGGGLLLSVEGKYSSVYTNYWIIISTAATDAKGRRIKL